MSRAYRITSLITFLCFVALSFASAQQSSATPSSSNSLSSQEQHFLDHIAKDSQGEVQLGKMAESKTSNPQVKEFAQKMVHDHTTLDQQIQQVMSKHGMSMPAPMTAEQQQLQKKLQGLSGQQFDRAYMAAEVKGHEQAIAGVSPHARNEDQLKPSHPDVAELAQEVNPVLKDHLNLAKQVAPEVGANTTSQSAEAR